MKMHAVLLKVALAETGEWRVAKVQVPGGCGYIRRDRGMYLQFLEQWTGCGSRNTGQVKLFKLPPGATPDQIQAAADAAPEITVAEANEEIFAPEIEIVRHQTARVAA